METRKPAAASTPTHFFIMPPGNANVEVFWDDGRTSGQWLPACVQLGGNAKPRNGWKVVRVTYIADGGVEELLGYFGDSSFVSQTPEPLALLHEDGTSVPRRPLRDKPVPTAEVLWEYGNASGRWLPACVRPGGNAKPRNGWQPVSVTYIEDEGVEDLLAHFGAAENSATVFEPLALLQENDTAVPLRSLQRRHDDSCHQSAWFGPEQPGPLQFFFFFTCAASRVWEALEGTMISSALIIQPKLPSARLRRNVVRQLIPAAAPSAYPATWRLLRVTVDASLGTVIAVGISTKSSELAAAASSAFGPVRDHPGLDFFLP